MTPLDLTRDPIAAAVRARAPEPRRPVWIFVAARRDWCVLRHAEPGAARITMLCSYELDPEPVSVSTERPHNTCPACETELAAGTPGAAVAVVPSRASTRDLRGPVQLEPDDLAIPRSGE